MTVTVVETAPGEETSEASTTVVETTSAEAAIQAETAAVVAEQVAEGVVALAHQQAAAAELEAAVTVAETGAQWQELSTRIAATETALSTLAVQMSELMTMVSSIQSPPVVVVEETEPAALIDPQATLPAAEEENRAVAAVKRLYRARL